MNKAQVEELIVKIQARWPSTKTKLEHADEWAEVLREHTTKELAQALEAYLGEGRQFAPTVIDLKTRIPKKRFVERSDLQVVQAALSKLEEQSFVPLAYKHPRGTAYRFVPSDVAERRGWECSVEIEGVTVKGFMEE